MPGAGESSFEAIGVVVTAVMSGELFGLSGD
jgi:hypothetical protein